MLPIRRDISRQRGDAFHAAQAITMIEETAEITTSRTVYLANPPLTAPQRILYIHPRPEIYFRVLSIGRKQTSTRLGERVNAVCSISAT